MLRAREWPEKLPRPQVSVEFELASPAAVTDGAQELTSRGYEMLHDAKVEPWGRPWHACFHRKAR